MKSVQGTRRAPNGALKEVRTRSKESQNAPGAHHEQGEKGRGEAGDWGQRAPWSSGIRGQNWEN